MIIDKEKNGIEKRFNDLCQEVVPGQGLSLYDLNYIPGNTKLCIFVINDATGSADIEDCVKVDRALSPYLEEDWVPNNLTLEVSSPGVFRNLACRAHFENAIDDNVEIVLTKKLTFSDLPKKLKGQRKIIAKLKKFNEEEVELVVDDYNFNVRFEDLKKVTLHSDING